MMGTNMSEIAAKGNEMGEHMFFSYTPLRQFRPLFEKLKLKLKTK